MKKISFEEALDQIMKEDPRYDEQAYLFIREALDYTISALSKPAEGPDRHVSGKELMGGVRDFAIQEYGALTYTVLKKWGIKQTEDIGALVFNLVDKGILGKTQEDQLEDFADGFDFESAFREPFLPKTPPPKKASKKQKELHEE